jgi:hypothetical protein
MALDLPASGAVVGPSFLVAGWAFDNAFPVGSGVDAVHVWAYPVAGGGAVFLGAALLHVPRPDVGAVFGTRHDSSGFGLVVTGLSPGVYDVVAYAHSSSTRTFNNARAARITVIP